MKVDSEFAGLLVAVGFLVMGLVSMPIATVFVLGAIVLGVVIALLLRFIPRKFSRVIVGTVLILAAFVLWWAGHTPRRPHTVSSNALYTVFVVGAIALGVAVVLVRRFIPRKFSQVMVGTIIILAAFVLWWAGHTPRRPHTVPSNALYVVPNNLPYRLRQPGYWLECWFDQDENVDRCKLTDEKGTVSFEDVFLMYPAHTPLPQSELVFERETGSRWIQSCDKRVNVPVVYAKYDQTLVPRSLYAEWREARCAGD